MTETEEVQISIDRLLARLPARLFSFSVLLDCIGASQLGKGIWIYVFWAAVAIHLFVTWLRYRLTYFHLLLFVAHIGMVLFWITFSSVTLWFNPVSSPSQVLLRWLLSFLLPAAPLTALVLYSAREYSLDAHSWPGLAFDERRNWARRIKTVESGATGRYSLIGGTLAVLATSILKSMSHEPLYAVLVFLGIPLMLMSILLPAAARLINMYRYLRRREKRRGRPYLIWDIDEIEEERSRSWLGRLCNPRLRRLHQSAQSS